MPLPTNPAARLARGAALPLRAAAWLGAHPEAWRWALLPIALTLAGVLVGLVAAAPLSGALLGLVWAEPAGWLAGLWWLTRAAVFLLIVYAVAVALPIALSGPFMDQLSLRVEAVELGAAPAEGGVRRAAAEAMTGAAHALARVALLLAGYAVLLPSLLVPFAFPALAFAWTAWWSAAEWLGVPMARHLHPFREVRRALGAVRPLGFGLGLTLAALFLLPLANLLVVPIGAVAGTLLYCDLVREGVILTPVGPRRDSTAPAP